jgi:hypothetical protein
VRSGSSCAATATSSAAQRIEQGRIVRGIEGQLFAAQAHARVERLPGLVDCIALVELGEQGELHLRRVERIARGRNRGAQALHASIARLRPTPQTREPPQCRRMVRHLRKAGLERRLRPATSAPYNLHRPIR